MADRPSVGNIRPALADLGSKTHLAHELEDKFVVDHPALVTQIQQDPTVTVAMLITLETFPNRVFEHSMFIRLAESFLVVEECRPWDASGI